MEATPIYPKRDLWAAARDGLVWLSGPVSERGASRAFRIVLHMGGRRLNERRLAMREHPIGRRLLDERPDLGAALNDMSALAVMPEGSLGRAFHTFMDHPETIPWDVRPEQAAEIEYPLFRDWFTPLLPVIDLGCGTGTQSAWLIRHYSPIIGLDVSKAVIEQWNQAVSEVLKDETIYRKYFGDM